jgi:hypothetical protein
MSTLVMSACWLLEMPPAAKSVLISLADNANDHGECWPSVGYIARRTCLAERTVQRSIQWLVAAGLLTTDMVQGRSTRYTVTPPTLIPPTPRHPRHRVTPARKSPAPATVSGEGCHSGTQTAIEPSFNQKRRARGALGKDAREGQQPEPSGRQPAASEVLAKARTTKPASPESAAAAMAAIAAQFRTPSP